MDAVFVNQITLTKEVLREFYSRFPGLAWWGSKIVLPVFGILMILLASFLAIGGSLFVFIMRAIFGLILIFFEPVLVWVLSKIRYRQQVLLNGGSEMWQKKEFADQIRIASSNKAETSFDYAQIKQIGETKHLILLRTAYAVGIIVGKDGFTVGTLEGFRGFIRAKCPSARFVSFH